MTENIKSLRQKIEKATELESMVSTMKALAASNISQYENALEALTKYYNTIELGLLACMKNRAEMFLPDSKINHHILGLVVFGSDQGLVGQFNDSLVHFVSQSLQHFHGPKKVWVIGERVKTVMEFVGFKVTECFEVPNSVHTISSLIENILTRTDTDVLYVFNNTPSSRSFYKPSRQRLLPFDKRWRRELSELRWPTYRIPEIIGNYEVTLGALIREYLFMSFFKAPALNL